MPRLNMAYNDCAFLNGSQLLRWKPSVKCSAAGTLLCVVLVLMPGFRVFFNMFSKKLTFWSMRQLEFFFPLNEQQKSYGFVLFKKKSVLRAKLCGALRDVTQGQNLDFNCCFKYSLVESPWVTARSLLLVFVVFREQIFSQLMSL